MTVKEIFDAVLPALGKSQAAVATSIGWSPQQLSQKLVRNSLRACELIDIFDANGIDLSLTIRDSGEPIVIRRSGYGRRLKKMCDRVRFDTQAAEALSNSFYADGENEYDANGEAQELYVDADGRYFIAEYFRDDPSRDKIRSVPAAVATAFIEKYGTDIHKKPE